MKELDKALAIALTGAAREQALETFHRQMTEWGLEAPAAEPFALDFGLGEFTRTGLVESWIANEVEAGYCAKYLFVQAGQACPVHQHGGKHETFFIVKGRVRMTVEGEEREMGPGDTLAVSPGTKHGFRGLKPALLLEASQPCVVADNLFEDERIPIGRD